MSHCTFFVFEEGLGAYEAALYALARSLLPYLYTEASRYSSEPKTDAANPPRLNSGAVNKAYFVFLNQNLQKNAESYDKGMAAAKAAEANFALRYALKGL